MRVLLFITLIVFALVVNAQIDEKVRPPTLSVTGEATSRAPLSLADLSFQIEVRSSQFGTEQFRDIEPFGDNVPKLPSKDERNHEFYFTQDNSSKSVFCSPCVQKEVTRRSTSLINYIHWLNSTDLSSFSLAVENINLNIRANPHGNGFTNLKTVSITTRPDHKWVNNENKLIGYIGTATINVRVPSQYSHLLLNKALDIGATQIQNVNLVATDADIAQHQQIADAKAAVTALERAQNVLNALNLKLAKIQNIHINSNTSSSYAPRTFAMESRVMALADSSAASFGSSAVGDNNILVGEDVAIRGTVALDIQFT